MTKVWIIGGLGSNLSEFKPYEEDIKRLLPSAEVSLFHEYESPPEHSMPAPIVIAHSYGVSTAWKWNGIGEHLFAIDGVPNWSQKLVQSEQWSINFMRGGFKQIDCYYRAPQILPPYSCKLRYPVGSPSYRNHPIYFANHWNIVDRVKDDVMERLKAYVE